MCTSCFPACTRSKLVRERAQDTGPLGEHFLRTHRGRPGVAVAGQAAREAERGAPEEALAREG